MLDQDTLFTQVESLLGVDRRGRLVDQARQLYVFRTPQGVLCRRHADLPEAVGAALEAIAHRPRGRPREWAREHAAYLNVLWPVVRVSAVRAGPVYVAAVDPEGGEAAVSIDAANAGLLLGGLDEWIGLASTGRPTWVMVADGRAVAICTSVGATADAHTAGVETAPHYRGRGFAAGAVAAWARAVRALGATAFYATSVDNIASQGVARRLGLTLVGAEFWIESEGG